MYHGYDWYGRILEVREVCFSYTGSLELLQTCLNSRIGMQALWDREGSAEGSAELLEA